MTTLVPAPQRHAPHPAVRVSHPMDRAPHPVPHSPHPAAGAAPRPALTRREVEVLIAWFGSDSKVVACRSLFISLGTLNTHLGRIRRKYTGVGRSASTKAALFARALQDGYIELDDW